MKEYLVIFLFLLLVDDNLVRNLKHKTYFFWFGTSPLYSPSF